MNNQVYLSPQGPLQKHLEQVEAESLCDWRWSGVLLLVKEAPPIILKSALAGGSLPSLLLASVFRIAGHEGLLLHFSAGETERGWIGTGGKRRNKWVVMLPRAVQSS